ncbi:MAG: hypothetical protein ACRD20_20620 [Terriglobales bacterium]
MRKPGKWTPLLECAAKLEIGHVMLAEGDQLFANRLRAMLHVSGRTSRWRCTVTVTKGKWWLVKKVGEWRS